MKTTLAAAAMLLGLTGCAGSIEAVATATSGLESAYDACSSEILAASTGAVELADGGDSILIDTANEDEDITAVVCIFMGLETSDALIAQMDSTTAMMGRQEAESNGYTYEWSYHPDSGINMTITE